jgi:tRNA A37 threonylcarbamoyladenosine synthetase subunit TsaC/SUA5/YrdC
MVSGDHLAVRVPNHPMNRHLDGTVEPLHSAIAVGSTWGSIAVH